MKEYIDYLITNYRNNGLLIDANLLILLIIGNYNISFIEKFKRTEKYTKDDYMFLKKFSELFVKILTIPNILTEACNLSLNFSINNENKLYEEFKLFIHNSLEEYIETKSITSEKSFSLFGVSDTVIINLCKKGYLLITDDLKLYHFINGQKYEAINFNHIRGTYLLQ